MPDSARGSDRDSVGVAARAKAVAEFVAPAERGPDRMPARRPFTSEHAHVFDPFLYLTHFGPRELHETDWGFGPHPHRGFETITYLLAGGIEHRDSTGGHAVLGAGDVQWMTAGGGIIHSEQPPAALKEKGGIVHGFQLWLNLPRALKLTPPGFSVLRGADMPKAEPAPGVTVRVIGGRCGEIESPVRVRSPVLVWHVSMAPGARWRFAKEEGWSAVAYAYSEAECGRTTIFDRAGETVALAHEGNAPLELLVLGGQPFGEPVASYGPFVMSTREEIVDAVRDYQSGRMGSLPE